ncbi:SLC13 family permease [Vibrio owensii]|uniref:SLC13 family permease n=1 Tax=Vibrio owensii TaxID=696485 RepID=A0AAP9GG88_9VIBR|nr:SLC13 family permease [Vibrio owensii]AYO17481.1 SLC13 family permease [Vibrio owensii]QGH49623.1 SLC13 family permease [Vibrio owensii]
MASSPVFVAAVLIALLIGLTVFKLRPLLTFSAVGAALFVSGAVEQQVYLQSFANSSLIALILLIICSLAVEKTFHVKQLGISLFKGLYIANYLRLIVVSSVTSGFANNTAVVATLLSCIKSQLPKQASRYLLPLSYASILGGTLTLVGTSTNLIVSSFAEQFGLPPLAMFSTTPIAAVVLLACLLCLVLAVKLLPRYEASEEAQGHHYFIEAKISSPSLVGKSVADAELRHLESLYLTEIVRDGRVIAPVGPDEVLQLDDTLLFSGDLASLHQLQQRTDISVHGVKSDERLDTAQTCEVVVLPDSVVAGKDLKQVHFRSLFDASVLGIRRGDQQLSGGLGSIKLRAGDMLLLTVGNDFKYRNNLKRNFVLLDADILNDDQQTLSKVQSNWVIAGFLSVIGLSAVGLLPLLKGLLLLLGTYVLSGVLTVQYVRRRIPFEIIIVVGSALTLADAMQTSGLADLISGWLLSITNGYGVYGAFVGVFLATLVLTELITNNAAAAIIFPIAFGTAQQFGVDAMPFVMAVAFGASASFLSPFGYQTNLMVYSAGNYQVKDYFKFGLPVSMVYSITAILMIPIVYPF